MKHNKDFKPEVPEECDLTKDRILLHSCCAPCSTAILEWMAESGVRPVVFFSNSNIYPFNEYQARRDELVRLAASYDLEVIDDEYDHEAWLTHIKGLEREPERGRRCQECFRFRLRRAAAYAASHGYRLLTTTLASSRWKDLKQVNEAGEDACKMLEVNEYPSSDVRSPEMDSDASEVLWWGQNWRKGGLQERRSRLIRELGLYNQTFCGCEFSHREQHSDQKQNP